MACHESILGLFRSGDFMSHQYVNVGDKGLFGLVTAFNPEDITLGNFSFLMSNLGGKWQSIPHFAQMSICCGADLCFALFSKGQYILFLYCCNTRHKTF
jgi:hypothetical protein